MYILHTWRTTLAAIVAIAFAAAFAFLSNGETARAQAPSESQWVHSFSSSQDIQITSMSLSGIGEVFIAGTFHGSVDFDPSAGETLLASGPSDTSFIAKYDPWGSLVWAYRLVGSGDVRINDIVVDSMSQIGVVGSFEGSADLDPGTGVYQAVSKGGHDIFLLRLLPDGNLQWGWAAGDSEDDMGFAITTDSRSALYITGKFEGKIYFQSGSSLTHELSSVGGTDAFAARFNNAGTLFWVNVWGGDEDDSGTDLDLDGQDNVFVTGTFAGEADLDPLWTSYEARSRGRDDVFVIVMTQFGGLHWSIHMGSTGTESNAKILVQPDGAFFVSAQFERSADFFDLQGHTATVESRGGQDIFLARFTPPNARNLEWAYSIGGAQNETLAGIVQDGFDNVYMLGTYAGTADFDPGAGINELTSSGAADIFLAKYTRAGEFRRVQSMVNPLDDRARALAVASSNNVLIAGEFSGTLDLSSGLVVSTGQPDGVYNAFVAHYALDTWTSLPDRAYLPGIIAETVGN
jgi:hypothetical protein